MRIKEMVAGEGIYDLTSKQILLVCTLRNV